MSFETEAVREFARNVGRDRPDQAWILSFFDTWEPNPFYAGPPVPHPEDDPGEGEVEAGPADAADDIPF